MGPLLTQSEGGRACAQGDVGCGKTAVAFLAIMAAAGSGSQAAMMLPTEILAAQTHAKLQALLQRMPADLQPRTAILTGSTRTKERREVGCPRILACFDATVCRLTCNAYVCLASPALAWRAYTPAFCTFGQYTSLQSKHRMADCNEVLAQQGRICIHEVVEGD